MIPASYLFKDIYHQHWEENEAMPARSEHVHFLDGLMRPALRFLHTLPHRQARPIGKYLGVHAYD